MNKGMEAARLIKLGWRNKDIVKRIGINEKTVSQIRSAGGYERFLALRREKYREYSKSIGTFQRPSTGKRQYTYDPAAIISAVDAGKSYAEVARLFGIASRNVVAGVMNRRPEARGTNT